MDIIITKLKNNIEKLPKTTGVYLFFGGKPKYNTKHITPIYIGKAINIKNRVKNHFSQPSYRDNLFINKATKIRFVETNSEIEALILEAQLIKKHQPRFNVVWRDDKNYFYVAIAQNKDKLPYIFITHQPTGQIANGKWKRINEGSLAIRHKPLAIYVGPFVDGNSLKKSLKFLRRVFPFYTSKKHPKNKCTWCHLGLCPGPNPDLVEYKKSIKKLILVLRGKRKNVLNSLKKDMSSMAKEKKFEDAGKIRDRIYALEQIMAHTHVIENSVKQMASGKWQETERLLMSILNIKNGIEKIECYDISNIQGKSATGSMVVFKNGEPDKSQYKKFRIRMKNEPNDIAMLKEVLKRRLNHPEWSYPQVILIDGGIGQLNAGLKIKNQKSKIKNIRFVSLAKGRKELWIEDKKNPIPLKTLPQDIYNLIIHLDDEAHRFAIAYHRKLRKNKTFQ